VRTYFILVGEMRDLDPIRFALRLAETRHVVFAALHTNDTAQAVERLIDVFPGTSGRRYGCGGPRH
jgi:twitching motility protein PilT